MKVFKSDYKYRIKVEVIDNQTYYTPQRMNVSYRSKMQRCNVFWVIQKKDYNIEDTWYDLPITPNDSKDKVIAEAVIDNNILMDKKESGLFVKEYINFPKKN